MARILSLKAKVVHKSVLTVLLFFGFYSVISQGREGPSDPERLTLTCNSCSLRNLLNDLERQSGLHFIYSTNIIDVNKLVSFKTDGQPIYEVLYALGNSIGLTFSRNGQHVVIKKREIVPSKPGQHAEGGQAVRTGLKSNPEKNLRQTPGPIRYSTSAPTGSSGTSIGQAPALGEIVIRKPPISLSEYFDAKKFSALPAYTIRSLNLKSNHRGWFVSGGIVMNDYSAGAELQAGVRSVFLVFRPAWLNDGRYHGSYGVGTSMVLSHNLSLNTIYTFALVNKKPEEAGEQFRFLDVDDIVASSRHHQLRFMMEYALTQKISVRGGLSVNFLETRPLIGDVGIASDSRTFGFSGYGPDIYTYSSMPYRRVTVRSYKQAPGEIIKIRMWMGWETSLSYKLNFYQRRR